MDAPKLTASSLEIESRVATLTFDRDDVRNELTGTGLVNDIVDSVAWCNRNAEISVLVMTGAGSAFSAGGNIKDMRDRKGSFGGTPVELQDTYRRGIQQMPLALHGAEIPLIAAVNGPAIGAGMDLACMCDLRIGSTKARLGETFINLGIIPGDGGAWFLQRLIGYQRAAELTLTGRIVGAEEALQLGILMEVVEPDELMPRALELAHSIAAKPPVTTRFTKRLLKMAQREQLQDFLDLCAALQSMCHHTEDHLEAVNAFLEKRSAVYLCR
ncbi:MAG: enoyl-CoA hydratase-related protein [Thermoleophilia bacterium]|nr:enoyl-CoA hydratase-related protein [Thermoleophilia bacterium]